MGALDLEQTYAMIKPDAVAAGKAEEIMHLIEYNGFTIIAKQKLQLTRSRAEEFYGEHRGKAFFDGLVDFMCSGPVWALVLSKPNAILAWREMLGPTNSFTAKAEKPRSLRALYGTDGRRNACHGSDSPQSAAREIKFYFPALILEPLLDPTATASYISKNLQPSLTKALTALAREKPSADKFEAITFLANFLLNNNPNKPRIVTPDSAAVEVKVVLGNDDDEADFANAKKITAPDSADEESFQPTMSIPPEVLVPQPAAPTAARPSSARPTSARPPSAKATTVSELPPAPEVPVPCAVVEAATAMDEAGTPVVVPEGDAAGTGPASMLIDVDPAEAEFAATKVQAAVRGHQARRQVSQMRAEAMAKGPDASTAAVDPEPAAAAAEEEEAVAEPEAEAAPPAAEVEVAPAPAPEAAEPEPEAAPAAEAEEAAEGTPTPAEPEAAAPIAEAEAESTSAEPEVAPAVEEPAPAEPEADAAPDPESAPEPEAEAPPAEAPPAEEDAEAAAPSAESAPAEPEAADAPAEAAEPGAGEPESPPEAAAAAEPVVVEDAQPAAAEDAEAEAAPADAQPAAAEPESAGAAEEADTPAEAEPAAQAEAGAEGEAEAPAAEDAEPAAAEAEAEGGEDESAAAVGEAAAIEGEGEALAEQQ